MFQSSKEEGQYTVRYQAGAVEEPVDMGPHRTPKALLFSQERFN